MQREELVEITDPTEGLAKLMVDLSVKEKELGSLNTQLRNKIYNIIELEEQVKNSEILLSELNADKNEALKEIKILQRRSSRKSSLKETNHVI
jgi:hypothetical protein